MCRRTLAWSGCVLILAASSALGTPIQSLGDATAGQKLHNSSQPSHHSFRRVTLDERVKALATALDLTEQQQAEVRKILEERQMETLQIRDSSIPGSARIDRLRALQDQTVLRIRSVLNEEQKKKYDPLAVRKVGHQPEERTVEDWLKATGPAPMKK